MVVHFDIDIVDIRTDVSSILNLWNILDQRHKRTTYFTAPFVAKQVAIYLQAIHVLVVVDIVVVGAVVNHLRHEQIERGYGNTQTQEIEQGGYAVATKHI